jgi:AcrR family transcriptional regulator
MAPTPHERRAARHQLAGVEAPPRKRPITVDLIVTTAFGIVETEGYEALTMRRLATALGTGPSSLYAHVVNKEDLDELLIGHLCAQIELPDPDPADWRRQILDVCGSLREQYLRYPGISRATFAAAPSNLDTMRLSEGLLAILLAGGVDPQRAAWTIDALMLYVNAHSLEVSVVRTRTGDPWVVSRDDMLKRFAALPDTYPHTRRHAAQLTNGSPEDRFAFTITLMLQGLTA